VIIPASVRYKSAACTTHMISVARSAAKVNSHMTVGIIPVKHAASI
jgi:hypothetical protein